MLISRNLHRISSETYIKNKVNTSLTPFKGQEPKHTNVKWCIDHAFKYVHFGDSFSQSLSQKIKIKAILDSRTWFCPVDILKFQKEMRKTDRVA